MAFSYILNSTCPNVTAVEKRRIGGKSRKIAEHASLKYNSKHDTPNYAALAYGLFQAVGTCKNGPCRKRHSLNCLYIFNDIHWKEFNCHKSNLPWSFMAREDWLISWEKRKKNPHRLCTPTFSFWRSHSSFLTITYLQVTPCFLPLLVKMIFRLGPMRWLKGLKCGFWVPEHLSGRVWENQGMEKWQLPESGRISALLEPPQCVSQGGKDW